MLFGNQVIIAKTEDDLQQASYMY